MKTNLTILVALIILNSCSTTGSLSSFRQSSNNAFVEGKNEFIELKDGKIIEDKIDKLEWRGNLPMIQSSKFTVGGNPYRAKEINAIQSKNRYFRRTVYNDFAERIIKGKVNVYRLEKETAMNDKGRITSYTLYYLQKGDNGALNEYDNKLMEKTISDNPDAVAKFNDYKNLKGKEKKQNGSTYLSEVIETYNK